MAANAPTTSQHAYFPSINYLRAFAAISVFVHQVIEQCEWKEFPTEGLLSWFRIGWMGVDLFFVISGFVIGLTAFAGIEAHGEKAFRMPFLRRRLARIVPLHYLTMLVFVVFITPELLFENFWPNAISHLFFVHNFSIKLHGGINGSNWSLATEMQFYLFMLIIGPWLLKTRYWKIAGAFVGGAWLWRYGVIHLVRPDTPLGPFPIFVASTQLPGMLDEFAIGILLAKFIRSATGNKLLAALDNERGWTGSILLSVVTAYTALSYYWPSSSYWDHPMMVVFFRSLLALTGGAMVFAACLIRPKGIASKLAHPLAYLGTISYGIYLWHLPVILSLKRIKWLTPGQILPLALGITLVMAAASWHFFESPFIRQYSREK